ncbi:MAG: tRNA (N6-isopentenyl adenosine(37)-C2)-methylthiotransferase MiaB [Clostridiales bacterium]|nr:tRNA (N6-isopentenyl adenosine(37)-C2)-methylthiotransferase MiaB [Clostridiales bacterium]
MSRSYHIITFGCQMNERDSETLAGMLEALDYVYSADANSANIVILNTCSVRENADNRFFGILGSLKQSKRENPSKIICVCGCMMQQKRIVDILNKKFPWVVIVFGTHNISDFPSLLENASNARRTVVELRKDGGPIVEDLPVRRKHEFKAFVNIMYGCNNFCSYCIVPYTRGRERSRRPANIISEIEELAKGGCREVMLLGQNVNSYGKARYEGAYCSADELGGGIDFAGLLRRVDEIEGIERIRFMTSHPKDMSNSLIECFGSLKHLCRALHLPVQSGSDRILKAMNRCYSAEEYLRKVEALRAVCPEIAISTDIIVGFPGETEEDFERTLDMVKAVRYESAFTFIYSIRQGTPAALMENQVPEELKSERYQRLTELIHEIQAEIAAGYQDKLLKVLIEGPSKTDASVMTGRSESGKTVDLKADASLIGQIVPVRIIKAQTFSCYGELV